MSSKRRSHSPIKKLRIRRTTVTPEKILYEIVSTPPQRLDVLSERPETSDSPKIRSKLTSTVRKKSTEIKNEDTVSNGVTVNKISPRKKIKYGMMNVDEETLEERLARFGLEKEASESSDSDEPSRRPVQKKHVSLKKPRKKRISSPVTPDSEVRLDSPEPEMKSAVDALLPSLSVLRSMTPAEWIPRAVSVPRDNPSDDPQPSSILNFSKDETTIATETGSPQQRVILTNKQPNLSQLSPKPMNSKVVFSFANLGLTHNAPVLPVKNKVSRISNPTIVESIPPPVETHKFTRDIELPLIPFTVIQNVRNENLPPATSTAKTTMAPSVSVTRGTSKSNAHRKIDLVKLRAMSTRCDQDKPGAPKMCASKVGRIRLEPLTKTSAPLFVQMSPDKFKLLMPKLTMIPLAPRQKN